MFVIKKVLTPFLLPPGLFVLLFIFTGGVYMLRKKIRNGILLVAFGCSMWLLAIAPVSNALLEGLEKDIVLSEKIKGDVIILLGGGIYDKVPDLSGVGAPSEESLARIVGAFRLQKRLHIPIIVSGGRVFHHVNAEAPIAGRLLMDLGVSASQIITEDKSRDTFENAVYTKKICEKHHFKKPILITSAYHMKRALISFKKAGIEVIPFPTGFKSWKDRQYGWNDYLPKSFENTQISMREYLGLIYTSLLL